jgi:hypothetical protein
MHVNSFCNNSKIIQELRHSGTAELVFFFFLLFVSIIIMNLLVGLAISNITEATASLL